MEQEIKVLEEEFDMNDVLSSRYGNGFFVSSKKSSEYSVGKLMSTYYFDNKSKKATYRYFSVNDIFTIHLERKNKIVHLNSPSFYDIEKRLASITLDDTKQDELKLLNNIYVQLVKIGYVRNMLNPFYVILNLISRKDRVSTYDFYSLKSEERMNKYLFLLENSKIIKKEENTYVRGSKFLQFERAITSEDKTDFFHTLVADVVKNNSEYLHQYLHVFALKPFLEWSNAYYHPAKKLKTLIYCDDESLAHYYASSYLKSFSAKLVLKTSSIVEELQEAQILKTEGKLITGYRPILNSISQ